MKSENDVQYTVISPEGKLDTKFLPERVIVTLQTPPQYFLFGEEGPTAEVELSREGELIEQRWLLGGEPREYSPAFDDYFPLSQAERFNRLLTKSDLRIIKGDHDWCLIYPEKIMDFL